MSETRLFEIADEFECLLQAEISDADFEAVEERLNQLAENGDKKLLSLAKVIKEKNVFLKALKEYEESVAKRRKRLQGNIEKLNDYLLRNMKKLRKQELFDVQIEVKIRECPPSLQLKKSFDINSVPSKYIHQVTEVVLNKNKLKKAILDGEEDAEACNVEVIRNEKVVIE